MQDVQKKAWVTYLCIAGFGQFYPLAMAFMILEHYYGVDFKVNSLSGLLLFFSGVPLGTYGIYRTDWDIPSKIAAWILGVLVLFGCLIPFCFLVMFLFGIQATQPVFLSFPGIAS